MLVLKNMNIFLTASLESTIFQIYRFNKIESLCQIDMIKAIPTYSHIQQIQ